MLLEAEKLALKGASGYATGVNVESPWGDNNVLFVDMDEDCQDAL